MHLELNYYHFWPKKGPKNRCILTCIEGSPFGLYVKKSQKWPTQDLSNIGRSKVIKNQPVWGISRGLAYDNQPGGSFWPPPMQVSIFLRFEALPTETHNIWFFDGFGSNCCYCLCLNNSVLNCCTRPFSQRHDATQKVTGLLFFMRTTLISMQCTIEDFWIFNFSEKSFQSSGHFTFKALLFQ